MMDQIKTIEMSQRLSHNKKNIEEKNTLLRDLAAPSSRDSPTRSTATLYLDSTATLHKGGVPRRNKAGCRGERRQHCRLRLLGSTCTLPLPASPSSKSNSLVAPAPLMAALSSSPEKTHVWLLLATWQAAGCNAGQGL
jgi:hypothetical protein